MTLILVCIAVLLLIAAFWAYYRTVPTISKRVRVVLVSLRAIVFLLLLMLFADPTCVRQDTIKEEALVASLIDRSASMNLQAARWEVEDQASRFNRAEALASELEAAVESRGGRNAKFFFSDELASAAGGSPRADGQGTKILQSLRELYKKLEGENLNAIVLFSDGVETETPLTIAGLPPVPVFCVGLGDTNYPVDVRIKDIDYNPIIRAPSQTTLRVTLANSGGREKRVSLTLAENGGELFKKDIIVTPDDLEVVEEIKVNVPHSGRRTLLLGIDVDGYDAEEANNRREIVIDVKKAEVKILIVDAFPGWELHFLTDFLKREKMFAFDLLSFKKGNLTGVNSKDPSTFVTILNNYDALVLSSIGPGFIGKEEAKAIIGFVETGGKGMLVLPGPSSLFESPASWHLMETLLPLQGKPPFRFTFDYTAVVPSGSAATHPATADIMPVLAQTEWQERAPLLGFYSSLRAKAGAQVLLETRRQKAPVLVYGRPGLGRVAVAAAGPWWRWKFLPEHASVYDAFFSRLLDVLARGEEAERFSLAVKKNVFEAGEPLVVLAEVFDKKMQPVTGVPVFLEISRVDAEEHEVPLKKVAMKREGAQGSRFTSSLSALSPGDYRIRGEASLPGRVLKSSPLQVKVSEVSVEYQKIVQDSERLMNIAKRTGGAYVDASDFQEVLNSLPLKRREVETLLEITLRTSLGVFLLILLLLSVEWIVRKRSGMI